MFQIDILILNYNHYCYSNVGIVERIDRLDKLIQLSKQHLCMDQLGYIDWLSKLILEHK